MFADLDFSQGHLVWQIFFQRSFTQVDAPIGKLDSPKYVLREFIRSLDNRGVLVPHKGPRI